MTRRWVLLSIVVLTLLFPAVASASHFRGGIFRAQNSSSNNTVTFTLQLTWRRSAFGGSAGDGFVAIGDVLAMDGSVAYGDSSFATTLQMRVIAIDPINDVMTVLVEDPSTPGTFSHTYAAPGTYTAVYSGCCRLSTDNQNPDGNFSLQVTAEAGSANNCPVVNSTNNIQVVQGSTLTYPLPASDANGDTLSYRFATLAESSANTAITGMSIGASTGVISWPTTNATTLGVYSTQFIVSDGSCNVPVDMTFTVVAPGSNTAPTFDGSSPCGQTVSATPGTQLTLNYSATDPDNGDVVTLNNTGIPSGATFTPTTANPGTATFSWTPAPGDAGSTVILVVTASDQNGNNATPCSVTINVASGNDLSITKTSDVNAASPGDTITWTLTAHNAGPGSATAVTVSDTLPANLAYVSANASQGSCNAVGGVVTCNLGTMASGASATITLVTELTATTSTAVQNTATISSAEGETSPGNNTASARVVTNAVPIPTLSPAMILLMAGLLAAMGLKGWRA